MNVPGQKPPFIDNYAKDSGEGVVGRLYRFYSESLRAYIKIKYYFILLTLIALLSEFILVLHQARRLIEAI